MFQPVCASSSFTLLYSKSIAARQTWACKLKGLSTDSNDLSFTNLFAHNQSELSLTLVKSGNELYIKVAVDTECFFHFVVDGAFQSNAAAPSACLYMTN